jgi:hypothetical protein
MAAIRMRLMLPRVAAWSRLAMPRWFVAIAVVAAGCGSDYSPIEPAPTLPTSASVEQDGVRVTLSIGAPPLRIGTPHPAEVTVENLGTDDAIYEADDCGLAIDAAFRPRGDWNAVGVRQVGVAAAFKELALRGDQASGNGARSSLTPELFVGVESWGCRKVRIVRHLEPRAVLTERLQWDAWPGTPSGPFELAAVFGFMGREADPELSDQRRIEVRLPTAIVGDAAPRRIGPIAAVDVALADGAFAAFLATAPPNAWSRARIDREATGGVWRVGLSVDRGPISPGSYGEVAIDERTGLIIARRFDPPLR